MSVPTSSVCCDGRAIAQKIFDALKADVAGAPDAPVLSVILVGSNPASASYVRLKTRKAAYVGVTVRLLEFPETAQEAEVLEAIDAEVTNQHGIIVQLPLPASFNTQRILNRVPAQLDVDILSDEAKCLFARGDLEIEQPIVGSMKAILQSQNLSLAGKRVTVVGNGALVGKPAAEWFRRQGAEVVVADNNTNNLSEITQHAHIIVCGAGVPGLITPDMISEGVVILDAGTSEASGKMRGDADPACTDKASLYTPVPGGIGPITVAVLLNNVVTSHRQK